MIPRHVTKQLDVNRQALDNTTKKIDDAKTNIAHIDVELEKIRVQLTDHVAILSSLQKGNTELDALLAKLARRVTADRKDTQKLKSETGKGFNFVLAKQEQQDRDYRAVKTDVNSLREAAAEEERKKRLVDQEARDNLETWRQEAMKTSMEQLPVTYESSYAEWVDGERNTVNPFCARSPWTLLVTCRSFVETTPCTGLGQFCGVDINALTARLEHLIVAVNEKTVPTLFEGALHVWLFELVRHIPESLRTGFERLVIRAVTAYQSKNTINANNELERVLSYPDACLLLVIMLGIVNRSHSLNNGVYVRDVETWLFAKKPFADKCTALEGMWRLNTVGRKKASGPRLGYGIAALLALGAATSYKYANSGQSVSSVPAPREHFF